MKHWYRVKLWNPYPAEKSEYGTRLEYAESEHEAIGNVGFFPGKMTAELADANNVPAVKRGLAEATTEELRWELKSRGWKVTLS